MKAVLFLICVLFFTVPAWSGSKSCGSTLTGVSESCVRGCSIATHQIPKTRRLCQSLRSQGRLTSSQSKSCVAKGKLIPKRVQACLKNPGAFGL